MMNTNKVDRIHVRINEHQAALIDNEIEYINNNLNKKFNRSDFVRFVLAQYHYHEDKSQYKLCEL